MGRVLSVASECAPLVKTGGLADVVGALPPALAGQGWEMRVLIPAYRGLLDRLEVRSEVMALGDLFGGPARLVAGRAGALEVLALDAPHLYDRDGGPYAGPDGRDWPDNPERFAALARAAARVAAEGLEDGWKPDILHAHDWQAGLAPAYLRYEGLGVPSVMTIHNIAFQGIAPAGKLAALGLPGWAFTPDQLEYFGNISLLKAGLVTADAITTVSPRYAEELMRPEFGMGLEGVLAARAADFTGILNGIDTGIWNPGTDALIPRRYTSRSLARKAENRAALIERFGLGEVPGPLAVVVSRLTGQKGIDLLPEVIGDFVAVGGGLALLGSGDQALEAAMHAMAEAHPGRVGVKIGYDEVLSHLMFAGGDAVLVPSRFEPCGLTQMYGLAYGTPPLVAATGGLADTVINANPAALATAAATGITFHPVDALALAQALRRLCRLHAEPQTWRRLQLNGMKQPLGWEASAAEYARLYARLAP
ncbi:starch synthase [Meinhardsimonia xiamenensis]|jgi:starch synthase|uniref:Glycogen synthase n=1 Tax=Meinhardsimonia xiamenensis TaxID=990712 RepID=A0A1G9F2Q4_9RHOB|nr:glycogen synthase GlgA [Meinhardsimonia xiamenensis]PRX38020.1 starch synthase [Meinhardsimonia xiamenensis]SDK82674.1 starch synthase [Meinhardsimonia xiamenensis]